MNAICTAFGDQLNLCTRGTSAGFGIVTCGRGAEFSQCFLGSAQNAGKRVALLRVVDVNAIECDVALVAARSVYGPAPAVLVGGSAIAAWMIGLTGNVGHAGLQAEETSGIPVQDREVGDLRS